MDLFGWEDAGKDLTFAHDTSSAAQFVQQWKLLMRAQEGALEEVANCKLRRPFAKNNLGHSALLYETQKSKSLPRWRGPTKTLDIDETGLTATSQGRASKVARYCVAKQPLEKDVCGE